MHILNAPLKCGEKEYRAAVEPGNLGAVIVIQQPVAGEWYGCGKWYLSTLVKGGASDALSIDYGQGWQIDSGMLAAIDEAFAYLADQYKTTM